MHLKGLVLPCVADRASVTNAAVQAASAETQQTACMPCMYKKVGCCRCAIPACRACCTLAVLLTKPLLATTKSNHDALLSRTMVVTICT
jgi:hypothetical protein